MKFLKLTLSILSISLFIACGGNSSTEESSSNEKEMTSKEIMQQQAMDKEKASTDGSATEEKAEDKTNKSDVVELTIEGNDQMQFNKSEMRVKAGQTVKLTLKHVGEMTKQQMGHNWVLLKKGTSIPEFGQKAAGAPDNGYIPKDAADQIIAKT